MDNTDTSNLGEIMNQLTQEVIGSEDENNEIDTSTANNPLEEILNQKEGLETNDAETSNEEENQNDSDEIKRSPKYRKLNIETSDTAEITDLKNLFNDREKSLVDENSKLKKEIDQLKKDNEKKQKQILDRGEMIDKLKLDIEALKELESDVEYNPQIEKAVEFGFAQTQAKEKFDDWRTVDEMKILDVLSEIPSEDGKSDYTLIDRCNMMNVAGLTLADRIATHAQTLEEQSNHLRRMDYSTAVNEIIRSVKETLSKDSDLRPAIDELFTNKNIAEFANKTNDIIGALTSQTMQYAAGSLKEDGYIYRTRDALSQSLKTTKDIVDKYEPIFIDPSEPITGIDKVPYVRDENGRKTDKIKIISYKYRTDKYNKALVAIATKLMGKDNKESIMNWVAKAKNNPALSPDIVLSKGVKGLVEETIKAQKDKKQKEQERFKKEEEESEISRLKAELEKYRKDDNKTEFQTSKENSYSKSDKFVDWD